MRKRTQSVEPALFTVDQASQYLSIGRSTAYDLINARRISHLTVKGMKRVPKAALDAWIASMVR